MNHLYEPGLSLSVQILWFNVFPTLPLGAREGQRSLIVTPPG